MFSLKNLWRAYKIRQAQATIAKLSDHKNMLVDEILYVEELARREETKLAALSTPYTARFSNVAYRRGWVKL